MPFAAAGSPSPRVVQRALLSWYRTHRRDLPWRRAGDAYAVWVSEVMLQQTRVSVAVDYFERWMRLFPSVEALAEASEAEVLHAWQGLGYYTRARKLREGAMFVRDHFGGRLPKTVPELLEIPGVGRYSAGAIASIAYGSRAPIVDGNVVRVLCRLYGLRGDPAKAKVTRVLWSLAARLVPEADPADFNQAMMELGALVCTPRQARCFECPLAGKCVARREESVERLPEVAKRPPPTPVRMAAALVERRGRWLVAQLPSDAPRWASMWTFPTAELADGESPDAGALRAARETAGLSISPAGELMQVKHQVTRFRITLHAIECRAPRGAIRARNAQSVAWKAPEELEELAMPVAQRRIARRLS